jgi:hypothetical protein
MESRLAYFQNYGLWWVTAGIHLNRVTGPITQPELRTNLASFLLHKIPAGSCQLVPARNTRQWPRNQKCPKARPNAEKQWTCQSGGSGGKQPHARKSSEIGRRALRDPRQTPNRGIGTGSTQSYEAAADILSCFPSIVV